MATVYNVMLYGGLALAIVFAIVAVVLFFVLKIPKAVGIATGSTARKKIDEIKEKGYESVQRCLQTGGDQEPYIQNFGKGCKVNCSRKTF